MYQPRRLSGVGLLCGRRITLPGWSSGRTASALFTTKLTVAPRWQWSVRHQNPLVTSTHQPTRPETGKQSGEAPVTFRPPPAEHRSCGVPTAEACPNVAPPGSERCDPLRGQTLGTPAPGGLHIHFKFLQFLATSRLLRARDLAQHSFRCVTICAPNGLPLLNITSGESAPLTSCHSLPPSRNSACDFN